MPVTCTGAIEVATKMRTLSRETRAAIIGGVREFEWIELHEMYRLVPVDTGELINSGYMVEPKFEGNVVKGGLGFTADHAVIVHEDLEAFHPNGEAKFVETPLNAAEPYLGPRVAEYVARKLKL